MGKATRHPLLWRRRVEPVDKPQEINATPVTQAAATPLAEVFTYSSTSALSASSAVVMAAWA